MGSNHVHFGYSLSDLATLYCAQGRYREAETLYKRSIKTFKNSLGESHPNVGKTLGFLAMLHESWGHNQLAESYCKEALNILRAQLGSHHPWTIQCVSGLEKLQRESNQTVDS